MGKYWTRKGDQEDLDEKTTARPFSEFIGHGNMNFPDPNKQKTNSDEANNIEG